MAINATTYLVETKYLVDDKASRALGGIGQKADQASRSVGLLKQHFLGLAAAALGGGFLFGAKKAFVDFNSEMEQLQIRMAGLLDINVGGGFEHRLGTAKNLVAELQQRAEKSTSTTKELAGFLGETIQPLTTAGIRVRDLAKFTDLAVAGAKAFGAEATAALDIRQALGAGGVQAKDFFAQSLLGIAKMTNIEFNKLGSNKKLEVLFKALQHPAIEKMKGAQETSFLGSLSTTIDKLQLQLGKAGIPLFKAITAEIQRWNQWLTANPAALQNMATTVGAQLKSAFGFVKGVFAFIVNHKDGLLSIAKAFLVFKAVKFGTGLVTSGVQGVAGMISSAAAAFGNAGNASATLATRMMGAAGIISTAGAALAAGIQLYADWRMEGIEEEQNLKNRYAAVNQDLADMQAREHRKYGSGRFGEGAQSYLAAARRALASSREVGIVGKDNRLNEGAMRRAIEAAGLYGPQGKRALAEMRSTLVDALEAERAGAIATFKTLQESAEVAARAQEAAGRALVEALGGGSLGFFLDKDLSDRANAKDNINVKIAKVEVPAKDPDRWMIDLARFAAKQVRAPRQARAALRR